ncbi:MAG: peptidoglycan-binding domain-containing protein [Coriobacteriales bacterium]|jgi:peptidoglycan hydrolase-like protein with peptidoglycan-binding domain
METIGIGSRGAAVEDVQRRLQKLGYDLGESGVDGEFSEKTADAVEAFCIDRGISPSKQVDAMVWAALVDASFSLGDRTLYLKMPYFHGNDVGELQHRLNILGFACGPQDSIFGAYTERAVRDFQTNMGIEPDGIVGMSTTKALERLHRAWIDKKPMSSETYGVGFSRAAEVLQSMPVCVYGVDPFSREIASRISNLAFATTSVSKVSSADQLSGSPEPGTLMVEINCSGQVEPYGNPIVVFSDAQTLVQRFKLAVASMDENHRRVIVRVDVPDDVDGAAQHSEQRRNFVQHNAIIILDAICAAY